jgi:uncharacterized small protein (DUF1192 family)
VCHRSVKHENGEARFGAPVIRIGNGTHPLFSPAPTKGERDESENMTMSLRELEERIAIIRDNIRQMVEQAAAVSGVQDDARDAEPDRATN